VKVKKNEGAGVDWIGRGHPTVISLVDMPDLARWLCCIWKHSMGTSTRVGTRLYGSRIASWAGRRYQVNISMGVEFN
jgi:hypothetical protein